MKKFFQKKKHQEAQLPRSLDEIKKEYAELLSKAGNAQYLTYVYSKELEQVNGQLVKINQEAAARQELDKKESVVKKEETDVKA